MHIFQLSFLYIRFFLQTTYKPDCWAYYDRSKYAESWKVQTFGS